MKLRREIEFSVDGVEGRLKVVTGPFACKVYQDGRRLEGEKHIYKVRTEGGGVNGQLKIVRWFDNTVVAVFRGKKTKADARLSLREYLLGGLPALIVPAAMVCGFMGLFGNFFRYMAGAYVIGFFGALAAIFALVSNYTFMRICKDPGKQLSFSLGTFLTAAAGVAVLFWALGRLL